MQVLQLLISGIAQGCIYGLIALGFVLIYKATETVSFAQGELMMLGAFGGLAGMTMLGFPFWLAVLSSVAAMAVFGYTDLIHKLGGAAMSGLYATMTVQNPYLDEASKPIQFWAAKYKTKFNEDPTVFSVYGYTIVDTFAKAATKAGKGLSTESFIKAMDTMTLPTDMFGSAPATFTATKRLGSDASRLSQITDGKWKVISEYIK